MGIEHYETCRKIATFLEDNLKDKKKIYSSFPTEKISLPLEEEVILLEASGSSFKTTICLKIYIPANFGPQKCKDRTEEIKNLLDCENFENIENINIFKISFDFKKNAYVQKIELLINIPDKTVKIKFGEEEINAKQDSVIYFSKNIAIHNQPMTGFQLQNLGDNPKKLDIKANVTQDQLSKLLNIADAGKIDVMSVGNKKFKAIISSITAKLNGNVEFTAIETTK